PLVRAAARDVARCARRADPLELARAAYLFVTEHVSYRYQPPYIQLDAIPDYAIASGYGDCGVMALTFIALCRCLGVPARWQSGLYAAPSDIGAHDWAMFYTPDTGWLWADCSFGSGARRAGDEELRRFYFGNLDPWRTVCNRAFFAPFNPSCPGMRRDPFDNQMGEAACNGCGLPAGAIDQSVELVELEELPWKGRPA
ncbi:transglutaminase-like domain-containing protein, partial [Enorma massiliensis]|uniref:transglutaminase-like domain-containing protein n=1 Tax=Enorma massiliensis TaxID=1472761 RepID=UPI000556940E